MHSVTYTFITACCAQLHPVWRQCFHHEVNHKIKWGSLFLRSVFTCSLTLSHTQIQYHTHNVSTLTSSWEFLMTSGLVLQCIVGIMRNAILPYQEIWASTHTATLSTNTRTHSHTHAHTLTQMLTLEIYSSIHPWYFIKCRLAQNGQMNNKKTYTQMCMAMESVKTI